MHRERRRSYVGHSTKHDPHWGGKVEGKVGVTWLSWGFESKVKKFNLKKHEAHFERSGALASNQDDYALYVYRVISCQFMETIHYFPSSEEEVGNV